MRAATQEEKAVKLATPGQIRQVIEDLVPRDLSFDRARFLNESGILSDILRMDTGLFDRDAFCLANGIRPYQVINEVTLEKHWTRVSLDDFPCDKLYRRGLGGSGHDEEIEPALKEIFVGAPIELSGQYAILKFSRFIPDLDILKSFLDRDGFIPADFSQLLAYMYWWSKNDRRKNSDGGPPKDVSAFEIGVHHPDGRFPYFRWYLNGIQLELHEYGREAHNQYKVFKTLLVKVKPEVCE